MNVDQDNELTGTIIGAAIAVHRALGPGVDEPAYEEALSAKLTDLALTHERQKPLPIIYKRVPLVVAGQVPVFCLSVAALTPLHEARLLARPASAVCAAVIALPPYTYLPLHGLLRR